MKKWSLQILLSCALLLCAVCVHAAQPTAVVLPFGVDAPKDVRYLGKAVPNAVRTHLEQQGLATVREGTREATSAREAMRALGGAQYAIYGRVTVDGPRATITLSTVDGSGATWSKTRQAPLNGMTNVIQAMTTEMAREAMHTQPGMRTPGSGAALAQRSGKAGNSDIIVNETGRPNEYYLNPQFRYQGASAGDSSRIRTQRLSYAMVDMAIADFNGDGKNEIALVDAHHLYIYTYGNDGKLREIGSTLVSQGNSNYILRAIDLNRDGASELVIATFDESQNRPYTFFYSFRNNRLSQYCDRCAYFCSVVRMSPTYTPTLIGQAWDSLKLFRPGVHIMVRSGKTFALGSRLNLPKGANVFNFCWLPNSRGGDGEKLVVLREDERIALFPARNPQSPMHTTMERFSGSSVGMDHYKGMPGMGIDKNYQMPSQYYAPMRFITADIGRTGEYVLLTNKPISTAAQFFDRYRYFPQGEIHALYWDGVGLGLKWKTRRIRGSVAQIELADMNNDGILDLVVGINSSPEIGIGRRQCMITAYPLNTSATNPNAPVDMSDFEVTPNR
ncbi:MAG: VCBS repeat-containing protein [Desulfovibrionaceae bacterium]|nr:VCBS repeat-containing protein [Desulfovibrionaceae bacterium]